jgi:hypothetical protein
MEKCYNMNIWNNNYLFSRTLSRALNRHECNYNIYDHKLGVYRLWLAWMVRPHQVNDDVKCTEEPEDSSW